MYPISVPCHIAGYIFFIYVCQITTIEVTTMAKITKFHFYTKSEADVNKPVLLYVMFSLDKRYKISLGENVPRKLWDAENERCILSTIFTQLENRRAKRLNKFLDYLTSELTNLFELNQRWREVKDNPFSKPLTAKIVDNVKSIIANYHKEEEKEERKATISPTLFFEEYIERKCRIIVKTTNTFTNPGTVEHHKIVLKRFKEFLSYSRLIDDFLIFDRNFENKMENWMLLEKKYSANTIPATFSVMKVWLNDAKAQGIKFEEHYKKWRSKGVEVQHVYLNDEEIKKIYNIQFTKELKEKCKIGLNSNIESTKDLFICACLLGLRLSDWDKLTASNWDLNNNVVQIHTTKTKETVLIPLHPIVKEIYNKYNGNFPRIVDKSHINEHITLCCEIAEINNLISIKTNKGGKIIEEQKKKSELVSSHTGRRSFATNLYLKCKNAKAVMMFTGHRTEENFFKYICVDKIENAQMMQQYFE